jgi:hypothetical protein
MRRELLRIGVVALLSLPAGCDTDFATLVGSTVATLNMSVTALDASVCNGGSCSWFWQYSTNAALLSLQGKPACSGSCAGVTKTPRTTNSIKQQITSLTPNTTYYFQVCYRTTTTQPDVCASIKHFRTGPHARVDPSNTTRFVDESGSEFFAVGYNQNLGDVPTAEKTYDDPAMPVLKQRFLEIKNHGATTVRVELPEVTHAMSGVATFNKARMDAFTGVMDYAESIGLKVVLSGLWDYNDSSDNWYEKLGETERWNTQANYWREFARRLAGNSAVFSYNLINEANVPRSNITTWRQGRYGYWLTKTAPIAPVTTGDVARNWIRKMTAAIREADSLHMITMGGPWPSPIPYAVQAQELSYLSTHFYPLEPRANQARIDTLRAVKSYGKPVVEDEINGLTTFSNAAMEWLLLGAADTLNGALLTSCHEESCSPPETCPEGPDNFACQIGRLTWIDGARVFKNLMPVLKRTASAQGWLKQYNDPTGTKPRICGMPNEAPSGYSFVANTAKARLMADSTTNVILRFKHTDARNKYSTSSAATTFDAYAADSFGFDRIAGFVYPTQVTGTTAIRVYVNATGNEYLTAAPNEAALSSAGYSYNRILGYGWLP